MSNYVHIAPWFKAKVLQIVMWKLFSAYSFQGRRRAGAVPPWPFKGGQWGRRCFS